MKSCSVAQDDKTFHRPKFLTKFQTVSIATRPMWPIGHTVQRLVLHTAASPSIVYHADKDTNSVYNNGVKSLTFTLEVAVEPFVYRYIDTETVNLIHYLLRMAPVCFHIRFFYSNTMGFSLLQLFYVYESYYYVITHNASNTTWTTSIRTM